jgi:DNA-3-methyladenine glycosylase
LKLAQPFYLRNDVVGIARELLGKVVCTRIEGKLTTAMITETEAYAGVADKASHAYGDRRTKRTEPMYGAGGVAYIYLCYGIHHLFNVVTNKTGIPHAILIRSGKPLSGTSLMLERRQKKDIDKNLLGGPGTFAQALGIRTSDTGADLSGDRIWIEDQGLAIADGQITAGPRVGIDYAEEDAQRPYRFRLTENG